MDLHEPIIKGPASSDNSYTGTAFIKTDSSDSYFLLGGGGHALLSSKESDLGNPTVSGYVLSSTTAGVRSWVAQSGGGGITLTSLSATAPILYNNTTGVFSHSTGAGYNHIPTGGAANQYLKYSASGTAIWSALPADVNYYPTAFSWTGGTTAGPTGSLTGVGMSAVSYAAIPSASVSASGIVNTTTQSFAGAKTFTSSVSSPDFIGTSDIRLKENIVLLQRKEIKSIYKTFNFKNNKEQRVGVIAQELELEHPEFIRTDADGIKSVSYSDLHSAEIAYLKYKVEKLEELIIKLIK